MGDKDGCTGDGCCGRGDGFAAAAFVMKTYRMVEDPATDALISWGSGNNSFVVVDPFGFAQRLLPAHFKHSNFSSFIRQLNTYGFRKVDPDRWEFAHESFLRGQTHLLPHIVRRSAGRRHGGSHHGPGAGTEADGGGGGEVDDGVAVEVAKLKWEQRAVEEELRRMWRRVEETERRPRQMLAFLFKVVQNPHLLQRLNQPTPSAASLDGGEHLCPDDHTSNEGHGMLPGLLTETCFGLHPPEEELLGTGDLPLQGAVAGEPALSVSDTVGVFGCPSQFLTDLVGGAGGVGTEEVAAAATAAFPFALPSK